jgi:uncharacterized protein
MLSAQNMDETIVAQIYTRIEKIKTDNNVKIPLAIESGSRAWGFPSPDSDYDCRFVYVRPLADYLSLFPHRDVIETELTPIFDVNGWDLIKALQLMLKGNAVIIEWLTSPITYCVHEKFRADFLKLCEELVDRNRIGRHYLHLAYSMRNRVMETPEHTEIKKLFYVLRPAIAMRWLRLHEHASVAPMNFQELCAGADLRDNVKSEIETLLARKKITREMGKSPIPDVLKTIIQAEISEGEAYFVGIKPISSDHKAQANAFFKQTIEEYDSCFV